MSIKSIQDVSKTNKNKCLSLSAVLPIRMTQVNYLKVQRYLALHEPQ